MCLKLKSHLTEILIMKNIFKSIIITLLITSSCTNKQTECFYNDSMGVIPQPLYSKQSGSIFTLSNKVALVVKSTKKEPFFTAKYLQQNISAITGFKIDTAIEQNETIKTIVLLEQKPDSTSGKESYKIDISVNSIVITGESAGLFYGVQTLIQIIQNSKAGKTGINIPTCFLGLTRLKSTLTLWLCTN